MKDPIPAPEPAKDDNLDLNEALRQLEAKIEPHIPEQKPQATLSDSQKGAVIHLESLYKLRLLNPSTGGFKVRSHGLVAGPSGSGKTTAVRLLARNLGLPFFSISTSQWTIWNARNERYTLDQIRHFIRNHQSGVLLIDELDKLTSRFSQEHYWASAVTQEIFAIMDDGDERLEAAGFSAEDRNRLGRCFLLVGAGAWQLHWQQAIRQGRDIEQNYRELITQESGLPDELLFRFADPTQIITPPRERELMEFIVRIHRSVNLPTPSETELNGLAKAAVESGRAMRYVENYTTQLLTFSTADVPLGKLLASVPQVKPVGTNLLGETKTEASKRLFGELRASGVELDQLSHEIIQTLPPLAPESWLPVYRTLALDSLSTGTTDHFRFSRRELDDLPSSIRLDERIADMSLQRPALMAELRHVFVKVGEAAVSYMAVGNDEHRKVDESMLIIFGAWVAGRLKELLHGSDCIEIPYDLMTLLVAFIRAHTKWERSYNQLLALTDLA